MHTRALLAVFGSFGVFLACGGRASSPNIEGDLCPSGAECSTDIFQPEPPEPPDVDLPEPPEAELPGTVVILELRQIGDASKPQAPFTCEYESRIKVNLAERLLMFETCLSDDGQSVSRGGGNVELTDADVAVIESAYAELQLSDAVQCTGAAEVMTLEVSTNTHPDPERLLAGEDHAGCALARLEQYEFVSGLDGFRAVLMWLRSR